MNKYEIMFIVKATLESESVKQTATAYAKILTDNNSKVIETKDLGEKKLAYPIKKEIHGFYNLIITEATKEAIAEFDRKANLDENILRHIIIKLDQE